MVWVGLLEDAVVYRGLTGEVRVDRRAEDIVEMGVGTAEAFLRKTRAGGNWLTGGIVKVVVVLVVGGRQVSVWCGVWQDGFRFVALVLVSKSMVDGCKLSWMFCRSQKRCGFAMLKYSPI